MQIISLKPENKKRAAKVVADAFYDYKSLVYYFPNPKRRTRWLPWYMERVLNSALAFGEVLVTEDFSGVLFILPPGHTKLTDWDYIRNGFLAAPFVVGLRRHASVTAYEAYMAGIHERLLGGRQHYYLWGLAVDPRKQRAGAGSALLRELLKRADAEGIPVYLETHKEQNVPYYEQRGFKLIHTDTHGLEFWCMLYEPQEKHLQ